MLTIRQTSRVAKGCRLGIGVALSIVASGLLLVIGLVVQGGPANRLTNTSASLAAEQEQVTTGMSGVLEQPTTPLEKLLNQDGSINLSTGFNGSVDPSGWRMETGLDGKPRFTRAGGKAIGAKPQPLSTAPAASASALFSPLVPGDENWDDRFFSNGTSRDVNAIAISGTDMYVGGQFSTAGGILADKIARWNTTSSTWSPLGSGVYGSSVNAIVISGIDVYVGGAFNSAAGGPGNNIARWNTTSSTWAALGSGVNSSVNAIAITGTDVYVGGAFTSAGFQLANRIARWNTTSSTWSPLGSGVDNNVNAIAISGTDVYVGGNFISPGNRIARWNTTSSTWAALGSGVNSSVNAIAITGTDVYVGGAFTSAGGVSTNRIARWNASSLSWAALGSGLTGAVNAIVISGMDVYVGGSFSTAGGLYVGDIARWNTTSLSWAALGSGFDYYVNAIAITGTDVYVGGTFSRAFSTGGVSANNIARWNTTSLSWAALDSGGSGLENTSLSSVNAIAISGTVMYVGGYLYTAGGILVSGIARWNAVSSTWSPLGSGVGNTVNAIAISGTDVYVGGSFTTVGNYIARWDTISSSWSPLGSGLNNSVKAIAISGKDVYVGGYFTMAGGVSVNRIANWNTTSSSWSPLGSGVDYNSNGWVNAIAISGTDVYVSGYFITAGGVSANGIARWNAVSSTWSPLGSGCGGANAIAISGKDVYVGGGFTIAGGKPSSRFGIWHEVPASTPTPTITNTPTNTPTATPILVGHVTWQGRPAQPNLLQQIHITLTLKSGTTKVNFAQSVTDASGFFTVPVGGLANGPYVWRAKGPHATTPYTNTNSTSGFLATSGTLMLTSAPTTQQEMGLMMTADCNNDNRITALDFNIVKLTFGRSIGQPNYDNRADFTGDQVVSVPDFNLMKPNFGQGGAPPILPGGP